MKLHIKAGANRAFLVLPQLEKKFQHVRSSLSLVVRGREVLLEVMYVCEISGWKSVDSVPKLVEEYQKGKIALDKFITGHYDLSQINEAFESLHSGQGYFFLPSFSYEKLMVVTTG
ncbi:unnamed protein product [Gongylonema pulchrum]|uniref:Uncharacterized protein n=1 Tax=Gongylonema pulchrum TaxID=637853 RepID=A0A3P6QVI7_9BILA|nr:unnamed protein product [Gongylonema pulchrum]